MHVCATSGSEREKEVFRATTADSCFHNRTLSAHTTIVSMTGGDQSEHNGSYGTSDDAVYETPPCQRKLMWMLVSLKMHHDGYHDGYNKLPESLLRLCQKM